MLTVLTTVITISSSETVPTTNTPLSPPQSMIHDVPTLALAYEEMRLRLEKLERELKKQSDELRRERENNRREVSHHE